MQVEFSTQEIEELLRVIEERLGELSEEIHHATVSTYQDQLKSRKTLLNQLLDKLRG